MRDVIYWASFFVAEKYNYLKAVGFTYESILKKYRKDLEEHNESLPTWQDKLQEKKDLIEGLEQAIAILEVSESNGGIPLSK